MSKYLFNTSVKLRNVLIAMLALVLICMGTVAEAAEATGLKGVNLVIDGISTYRKTSNRTVAEFLASENIDVESMEVVNVDMEDEVTDSMRIVINTPFEVFVSVDGGEYESFITNVGTIGELIVELRDNETDTTYCTAEGYSSSIRLQEGDKIDLLSITSSTFTKTEVVPFETRTVESQELYVGESRVVQEGSDGENVVTMKSVFVGGELQETRAIDSMVTKEPVDKIIEEGTKERPAPVVQEVANTNTIHGYTYTDVITMSATAYCPCTKCCGSGAKGITASGMKAQLGVVAVDKRVIPLGTKLFVEGYGYCIAADTGSAIKGNKIDLCYNTHYSALHSGFGHTPVKVYILE